MEDAIALTPTPTTPLDITTAFSSLLLTAAPSLLKGVWIVNYDSSARQVGMNRVATAGSATNLNVLRPYASTITIAATSVEYWAFDMPLATGDTIQLKCSANSACLAWAEYGVIS